MKTSIIEIENKALEIRKMTGNGEQTGPFIFHAVEKLGIFHFRKPLGRDKICGFSAKISDEKIILTNSSDILAREIFTLAHEIGHCIFDLNEDDNLIFINENKNNRNSVVCESDVKELEDRANQFAAAFLMPESLLWQSIKFDLKKKPSDLMIVDIIYLQQLFQVSYDSLIKRLLLLNFINQDKYNFLVNQKIKNSLIVLYQALNIEPGLINPSEVVKYPASFYQVVLSNYQRKIISESECKEALKLVNFDESIDLLSII